MDVAGSDHINNDGDVPFLEVEWDSNVVIVSAILLCTTLWILFPYFKKRQKNSYELTNKELEETNEDIEEVEEEEIEEETDLPDEIYFEVFQYLEAHEREELSLVSWHWKTIVEDSRLWISLYHFN